MPRHHASLMSASRGSQNFPFFSLCSHVLGQAIRRCGLKSAIVREALAELRAVHFDRVPQNTDEQQRALWSGFGSTKVVENMMQAFGVHPARACTQMAQKKRWAFCIESDVLKAKSAHP